MLTKNTYTNRKNIELEFDCLPNNYSTVIMRNRIIGDTSKQKKDGENETYNDDDLEKVSLDDFMLSIGTVFGKAQGNSSGYLYYNDINHMQKNQKYSIYCIEEADGSLRVDFLPFNNDVYSKNFNNTPVSHNTSGVLSETVSVHESQTGSMGASDLTTALKSPSNNSNSVNSTDEAELFKQIASRSHLSDDSYQVPTVVFKGGKLQFLNDRVAPFIGVIEFI